MAEVRERYLRDELPTRLGGIAANLARVSTFSRNPGNKEAVNRLLDESKFFIEWTAGEATVETAAELVELQVQLARWQRRWDEIWEDAPWRMEVAESARGWSNRVLQASGLLAGG
jgi:hypothetical protein